MLKAKYEVGQKVYAVSNRSDTRQIHVNCDVCNSTGKVKVEGRNEQYECPVCHGKTEVEHYGYKYVISYYEAMIGKVQIEEYSKEYTDKNQSRVTYMIEPTGIGSGTIWREERLFATHKEAIEFCEKYISSDYYDTEAILKEEYKNR